MAIATKALNFWDSQANLRLQNEQQRSAEADKIATKLKAAINEMHTKHVAAVNIQQAKIHALEKEVDSEKATVASLQSRCCLSLTQVLIILYHLRAACMSFSWRACLMIGARTTQIRLQHETRQKRRLEDECALLDNRRALRQNFVQALRPRQNPRAIEAGGAPAGPRNLAPAAQVLVYVFAFAENVSVCSSVICPYPFGPSKMTSALQSKCLST